MNYLSNTTLSCFLALSTTAAMAAGVAENSLATLGEPVELQAALPSVHIEGGRAQKKAGERLLLEGFWPVMQQEEQLLFLQGGWLRQQQRNLLSAGLGWRYFPETDWGVGSNLFYDHDMTRKHRRVGLGAEAWWQSLTLTANGYLPASSWQIATDVKEYRARPAKGYDVSLQGYLPVLPHLGASVRYAHYVGDEVALGSSQHRQRNPKQWRWGLNITPIPLLTVGYHQQPGGRGPTKHQVNAALTYRFALPLSQQLDPNQITLLHSAEGQRLARVPREQLMALQYAKIATPPAPPQVVPAPPKPPVAPKPKELTSKEVTEYIEKINKAKEKLLEEYFIDLQELGGLRSYLVGPGGMEAQFEKDDDVKKAWDNMLTKKLTVPAQLNETISCLSVLIKKYDESLTEINSFNSTNQALATRFYDGLLSQKKLSNQYSAYNDLTNSLTVLNTNVMTMEEEKEKIDPLAFAGKKVAEAQKKVAEAQKKVAEAQKKVAEAQKKVADKTSK
jgi:Inverse autotransporter, beta-domain